MLLIEMLPPSEGWHLLSFALERLPDGVLRGAAPPPGRLSGRRHPAPPPRLRIRHGGGPGSDGGAAISSL